jgi:hypothetical protein
MPLPKIRFAKLPEELRTHLLRRVNERAIKYADLLLLQEWVSAEPEAPEGDWYKDFGSFKLCGTGELPKTVLTRGMKAFGTRID